MCFVPAPISPASRSRRSRASENPEQHLAEIAVEWLGWESPLAALEDPTLAETTGEIGGQMVDQISEAAELRILNN